MMVNAKKDNLTRFGFSFERGGVHSSRTMMLEDLKLLLSYAGDPHAGKNYYFHAIEHDNCLGKRSGKNRKLTARHLAALYTLDPSVTLYRALLYFWEKDPDAQPLLALLCAYARDSILRSSASFIHAFSEGQVINREDLEKFIESQEPGRFSKATLKSTAQNINSTWTKSGHLRGRAKKIRSRAKATPGAAAYALLQGYLTGVRGESLFSSEYIELLDRSVDRTIELAETASQRGWIVFKRVGSVIEVLFPNLITAQEMEWIREQN